MEKLSVHLVEWLVQDGQLVEVISWDLDLMRANKRVQVDYDELAVVLSVVYCMRLRYHAFNLVAVNMNDIIVARLLLTLLVL